MRLKGGGGQESPWRGFKVQHGNHFHISLLSEKKKRMQVMRETRFDLCLWRSVVNA